MPREFKRTDRIGAQLQRELADLIHNQLGDSRLKMITLQEVRVVRDLSQATVFFTLLGDTLERKETQNLLRELAPHLRKELGRRLRLRTIPQLHFTYDESVERGAQLSALIERAVTPPRE